MFSQDPSAKPYRTRGNGLTPVSSENCLITWKGWWVQTISEKLKDN